MPTPKKIKRSNGKDPLSQLEAKMVADHLSGTSAAPSVHWTTLWRMTPDEISEKYPITLQTVITACKRRILA